MKRVYSEKKFLIIGLIVSLFIHILFFSILSLTKKPEKQEVKKEKTIKISLIPYERKAKIQKNVGKKDVLKKKVKKKITKKKISKPKKKIIKKPTKKIKKQLVIKKEVKKIQKPKKIIKKQKTIEKKSTIKKEIVKKPKQPVETKKTVPVEKKIEKKVKPAEKPAQTQKEINKPSIKNLVIPKNLSKSSTKKVEKKGKEKDKAVIDYLKYIKIEFEKNKFYPDRAKKLGIEGIVILKFTILPDGTIDKNSIQVVEADHPFLAKGAVRIFEKIKKLKKPPPNGEKMTVEIPIQYILYELY